MATLSKIKQWCDVGKLPDEAEFFNEFIDETGLYVLNEGLFWDFKEAWPHSYSDSYWGGIARLICAFSNTLGGLIIFGVHDKKRDGGHNKILINYDKLLQSFTQLTGENPKLSVKTYVNKKCGDVTVLLVEPRNNGARPFRFKKNVNEYKEGVIWIRNGHEVFKAEPQNYPVLFCRTGFELNDDVTISRLHGSLPPSPNNLKKFVGRSEVIDELFEWLYKSDEPRKYLYGKGGSGKTAIAYEFSKLLEEYGRYINIYGGVKIDSIIFLSAKERKLNTIDGKIEPIDEADFSSDLELYAKILEYGGWSTSSVANTLNRAELQEALIEFLDMATCVIVIDDIDTLTTKGVDAGVDFMYRVLSRCKSFSKVLYTVRNAPSQSLTNSIEVPGLKFDGEYELFIDVCSKQFGVIPPSNDIRDGELALISERRPLVVESIMALRKRTNNYIKAIDIFKEHIGVDIRNYVFSREWDAIAPDALGRELLLVIAEMDRPCKFSEFEIIMQAENSRIIDAIGEIREMFLQVDVARDESIYSLAPLTRKFIIERREAVQRHNVIRERVRAFKRYAHVASPEVAAIRLKVERLLPDPSKPEESNALAAWAIVNDSSLQPSVTENPIYRCVKAYAAVNAKPPKLSEARGDFEYALEMNYEPEINYLKAWMYAERNVDNYSKYIEKISEIVLSGKSYSAKERTFMLQQKAKFLYFRGKDRINTDSVDARKDFSSSLFLQLSLYKINIDEEDYWSGSTYDYAKNTAYSLFSLIAKNYENSEIIDEIRNIFKYVDVYFDPIEQPITEAVRQLCSAPKNYEQLGRVRGKFKNIPNLVEGVSQWAEREVAKRLVTYLREQEDALLKKA